MSTGAYEKVKLVRSSKRQTGKDFIDGIFGDFFELHGDRRYADDPAIVGGIATLDGKPVTVIAIEKGHTARERAHRTSGAPNPEGYRKALRLMKQAEKFRRPVITFIDTSGAYCGIGAEERGQGQAIAENLMEMMTLKTPIIAVLVGEGESGGALALAVADRVWMLENSVYSVISPEGCASILWRDASRAADAADCLCLTAEDALAGGIIDEIIPEEGLSSEEILSCVKEKLSVTLAELSENENLTEDRYMRFRKIGSPDADTGTKQNESEE